MGERLPGSAGGPPIREDDVPRDLDGRSPAPEGKRLPESERASYFQADDDLLGVSAERDGQRSHDSAGASSSQDESLREFPARDGQCWPDSAGASCSQDHEDLDGVTADRDGQQSHDSVGASSSEEEYLREFPA